MDTPLPLEVSFQDRYIVIWYEGKEAVVIGATTSDLLEVALPNTQLIDLKDEPDTGERRVLHINARYRDPMEDGMLKYKKASVKIGTAIQTAPAPVKAQKVSKHTARNNAAPEVDRIDEDYRDQVLSEIIASYAEVPQQSKDHQGFITREIAERYNLSLWQVAGVRAALTRGRYGRQDDLVARFKRTGRVFKKNGQL